MSSRNELFQLNTNKIAINLKKLFTIRRNPCNFFINSNNIYRQLYRQTLQPCLEVIFYCRKRQDFQHRVSFHGPVSEIWWALGSYLTLQNDEGGFERKTIAPILTDYHKLFLQTAEGLWSNAPSSYRTFITSI